VAGPGDMRVHFPRFTGENAQKNAKLAATLERIATEHQATGAQVAIAWVLQQGEDIVPLLGSRTRTQLREALGALRLNLSAEEWRRIAEAIPEESVAGTRYEARQMAMLDSERGAKAAR
jgi:aryl-alcohol dehydrogenase-like predicted oxidoreductase